MSVFADLIARLEQATEGSRELDAAIARAIGNKVETIIVPEGHPVFAAGGGLEFMVRPDGSRSSVPPYTTSLDAALTLVPEGWRVAEMKDGIPSDAGPYCHVRLWCPVNSALGHRHGASGITPALALCIAALRAHAMEAVHG